MEMTTVQVSTQKVRVRPVQVSAATELHGACLYRTVGCCGTKISTKERYRK